MPIDKNQLPPEARLQSLAKQLGIENSSKVLYRAHAYRKGSIVVIDLEYLDASHAFIKVAVGDPIEFGGTEEKGTGVPVTW